jgi:hypothetical protein
MNGQTEVEALLKEHISRSNDFFGEIVLDKISSIGESFIQTHDVQTEKFLLNLLKNKNNPVIFRSLCCLLKAQKQGIQLQKETTEALREIKHSKNLKKQFVLRCVEKKLKKEATT